MKNGGRAGERIGGAAPPGRSVAAGVDSRTRRQSPRRRFGRTPYLVLWSAARPRWRRGPAAPAPPAARSSRPPRAAACSPATSWRGLAPRSRSNSAVSSRPLAMAIASGVLPSGAASSTFGTGRRAGSPQTRGLPCRAANSSGVNPPADLRVHVGAGFDERPDDVGVAFGDGQHQRGLFRPGVVRVGVCAAREQQLHDAGAARPGGRHERRLAASCAPGWGSRRSRAALRPSARWR